MQSKNCNGGVWLKTLPALALATLCLSTSCLQQEGNGGGDNDGTLAPASVGGEVRVADFTVPAGQTTTVTSDLTFNVAGNVRIDGQLVASPTESDGTLGVSIAIIAQGSIEIAGIVQAGDGMSANATGRASIRQQPADDSAIGRDGHDGGSIQLVSSQDISIESSASLVSGSGSDGASGTRGGRGGDGGVGVTPGPGGTAQAFGTDPLDVAARDRGDGFPPGQGGAGGQLVSITGVDGSTGNSIVGTVQTEDSAPDGLPGSNVDPVNRP